MNTTQLDNDHIPRLVGNNSNKTDYSDPCDPILMNFCGIKETPKYTYEMKIMKKLVDEEEDVEYYRIKEN